MMNNSIIASKLHIYGRKVKLVSSNGVHHDFKKMLSSFEFAIDDFKYPKILTS